MPQSPTEQPRRHLSALAMIGVGAVFPLIAAVVHGLGRPFTATPDADLIYMGEVFRALDGRPYFYADHPGYTYVQALAGWMKALATAGLIPRPGLAAALAAQSIEGYMQSMIWAGRLFSAITSCAFVAAAAWLVRRGGVSPRFAGLLALLLGTSAGVIQQAVVLRAELMAGGLSFLAFLCLAAAARRSGRAALIWPAAAGGLAILAMFSKVQAVFSLLALPGLALCLEALRGPRPPVTGDRWGTPLLLLMAASALPMAVIIPASMAEFGAGRPYQLLIAGWIAAAMAGFAALNRVPWPAALAAALALAGGMGLGFDITLLRQTPRVTDAVVNPIEHMLVFSALPEGPGAIHSLPAILGRVLSPNALLASHLLPLHLMEIVALAGACLAARRGLRRRALLAAGLAATALATETLFQLRGVFTYYLIFLEPWALLAIVMVLDDGIGRRLLGAACVALIAWQGVRSFDPSVAPVQPLANVCAQADTYLERDLAVRFHPLCRPQG